MGFHILVRRHLYVESGPWSIEIERQRLRWLVHLAHLIRQLSRHWWWQKNLQKSQRWPTYHLAEHNKERIQFKCTKFQWSFRYSIWQRHAHQICLSRSSLKVRNRMTPQSPFEWRNGRVGSVWTTMKMSPTSLGQKVGQILKLLQLCQFLSYIVETNIAIICGSRDIWHTQVSVEVENLNRLREFSKSLLCTW